MDTTKAVADTENKSSLGASNPDSSHFKITADQSTPVEMKDSVTDLSSIMDTNMSNSLLPPSVLSLNKSLV